VKISLKALRINRNLPLKEAATALNVTPRTLHNWEAYKTFPTAQQLMEICTVYGCELSDIFLPSKFTISK